MAGPPARPTLRRPEENPAACTRPQNARKLGFNGGIGGSCFGRKAFTGPEHRSVFLPSLVIRCACNRPRLRFVRDAPFKPVAGGRRGGGGPVCGPAECGGGAVLHAPSLAPVAPLRHHLHRPTYCVTRHAPSSRRCVVDFSTFSRVFRIFSFR